MQISPPNKWLHFRRCLSCKTNTKLVMVMNFFISQPLLHLKLANTSNTRTILYAFIPVKLLFWFYIPKSKFFNKKLRILGLVQQ